MLEWDHTATQSNTKLCNVSHHFDVLFISVPSVAVFVTVQPSPPADVRAIQEGPDGVLVSWTPPSGTNGYWISYSTANGTTNTVNITDGSIGQYKLNDLEREHTYAILIVATSIQLPSSAVRVQITLSKSLIIPAIKVLKVRTQSQLQVR